MTIFCDAVMIEPNYYSSVQKKKIERSFNFLRMAHLHEGLLNSIVEILQREDADNGKHCLR